MCWLYTHGSLLFDGNLFPFIKITKFDRKLVVEKAVQCDKNNILYFAMGTKVEVSHVLPTSFDSAASLNVALSKSDFLKACTSCTNKKMFEAEIV